MKSWVLVVLALGLLCGLAAYSRWGRQPPSAQPHVARPNVILIVSDDQPTGYIHLMPQTKTRLVDQGMMFTDAFVPTSLCCPSRASILSGAYASTHGITTLGGAPIFDASDTIATRLHDAGYMTALFGKYMNQNKRLSPTVPPGWDQWRTFADNYFSYTDGDHLYYTYELNENGTMVEYGKDPEDYSTDVLSGFATDFVRSAPEPFFLYFAPYAPHIPPVPAERHAGVYAGLEPLPDPSRFEEDVSDKPQYVQDQKAYWETHPFIQTGEWLTHFRGTMESLLALDEGIGRVLDVLDSRGIAERTLVLYLSDNGMLFGRHWGLTKVWPYEGSIKVPLYMRYPPEIVPGSSTNAIVANIDMAATICDVAGIDPPGRSEGLSLRPLFSGGSLPRESIYLEWLENTRSTTGPWLGIRERRWKYIWYVNNGFDELYHLSKDPYELDNLAVVNPKKYERMLEHFRLKTSDMKVRYENRFTYAKNKAK